MSDHDAEKAIPSNGNGAATDSSVAYASEGQRGPWSRRFVDSFKRDPNAHVTKSSERAVTKGFDHEGAAQATANSGLSRKLQGRHLQMIAIGGSIGKPYTFPSLSTLGFAFVDVLSESQRRIRSPHSQTVLRMQCC